MLHIKSCVFLRHGSDLFSCLLLDNVLYVFERTKVFVNFHLVFVFNINPIYITYSVGTVFTICIRTDRPEQTV